MTIEHENIGDANLHEPKGALAASVGQVYVANGSGGGVWQQIGQSEIDGNEIKGLNFMVLSFDIPDVSVDPGISVFVVVPLTGKIDRAWVTSNKANAGPYTVQMKIGGTNVTNGLMTVASGSQPAGTVDAAIPTAANTVNIGTPIEFAIGGGDGLGNDGAGHVTIFLDIG